MGRYGRARRTFDKAGWAAHHRIDEVPGQFVLAAGHRHSDVSLSRVSRKQVGKWFQKHGRGRQCRDPDASVPRPTPSFFRALVRPSPAWLQTLQPHSLSSARSFRRVVSSAAKRTRNTSSLTPTTQQAMGSSSNPVSQTSSPLYKYRGHAPTRASGGWMRTAAPVTETSISLAAAGKLPGRLIRTFRSRA